MHQTRGIYYDLFERMRKGKRQRRSNTKNRALDRTKDRNGIQNRNKNLLLFSFFCQRTVDLDRGRQIQQNELGRGKSPTRGCRVAGSPHRNHLRVLRRLLPLGQQSTALFIGIPLLPAHLCGRVAAERTKLKCNGLTIEGRVEGDLALYPSSSLCFHPASLSAISHGSIRKRSEASTSEFGTLRLCLVFLVWEGEVTCVILFGRKRRGMKIKYIKL